MLALDYATGATHQHQSLRQAEQLRHFDGWFSDETTKTKNSLTATRALGYWNRQLPFMEKFRQSRCCQVVSILSGPSAQVECPHDKDCVWLFSPPSNLLCGASLNRLIPG